VALEFQQVIGKTFVTSRATVSINRWLSGASGLTGFPPGDGTVRGSLLIWNAMAADYATPVTLDQDCQRHIGLSTLGPADISCHDVCIGRDPSFAKASEPESGSTELAKTPVSVIWRAALRGPLFSFAAVAESRSTNVRLTNPALWRPRRCRARHRRQPLGSDGKVSGRVRV